MEFLIDNFLAFMICYYVFISLDDEHLAQL